MYPEEELFRKYVQEKGLRWTKQRESILQVFLTSEKHLTLEDITLQAKKIYRTIDLSTVYRNMQILLKLGLAQEWKGTNDKTYFEHQYQHKHHDHMICEKCGSIVEFADPVIEELQERAAKQAGFMVTGHKLVIYGRCAKCRG